MERRHFLRAAGAGLGTSILAACGGGGDNTSLMTPQDAAVSSDLQTADKVHTTKPTTPAAKSRVIVVGGGMAGATVAKYLRLWGDNIEVTLVERANSYTSNIMSSMVLTGQRTIASLAYNYDKLVASYGVKTVFGDVVSIDPVGVKVTLASGTVLSADRIVLAPGIQFDDVTGLGTSDRMPHAWQAGAQTTLLASQLKAMPAGGTVVLSIPKTPYRCPPGPYERASLVAAYFKRAKPRSKVLVLDANPDIVSKGPLFRKAWAELYPGMLEYRGEHRAVAVEGRTGTVKFDVQDDVKADVLNVLPTMRAGELAVQTGLANANARWCHVDFLNFESTVHKHIHVIGDAIQTAAGMPKSGQMANSQAKVTAAAIVAELLGLEVDPHPMLTNVCMSFVDETHVIHVASVHEYVPTQKTFRTIGGSGGVSDVRSDLEGRYAQAWARNIWADALM
jgi:NADPH-dependent 2,4-dienoyl-CoA reductase/sulfur reductase-like enzyme